MKQDVIKKAPEEQRLKKRRLKNIGSVLPKSPTKINQKRTRVNEDQIEIKKIIQYAAAFISRLKKQQ